MCELFEEKICIATKYVCFITEFHRIFLLICPLSAKCMLKCLLSCRPGGYENISSGDDIDDIIGDLNDDDQDEQTGRKSGALSWKHKNPSFFKWHAKGVIKNWVNAKPNST